MLEQSIFPIGFDVKKNKQVVLGINSFE